MKANLLTVVQIENEEQTSREQSMQEQAQLSREMAHDQQMMLDREARIRQIEADILDVNQIFSELGTMIHDQGDNIGLFNYLYLLVNIELLPICTNKTKINKAR